MIEYNSVLRTGESEAGTMIFMIYKWIDNFKINRIQKPESVKNTAICKPASWRITSYAAAVRPLRGRAEGGGVGSQKLRNGKRIKSPCV